MVYVLNSKSTTLLLGEDSQAIQVRYSLKSVRWHDDGSSEHPLGYAPLSVYPGDKSSCRI